MTLPESLPVNEATPERTYTPPPVRGYRELTQAEVDSMNECKKAAEWVGELVERVRAIPGIDHRWASIAQTDLQKGFMSLIRAIAKPTTF
jgi:hypothetical protein